MMVAVSDGEALFRAILDDPDDDLPRLAYADWLEENDRQPRAQLIRLMCEAARLAPSREPEARRRCEEATTAYCALLARHEAEWLAELPPLVGASWGFPSDRTLFRRGFVHAVTVHDGPGFASGPIVGSPVEWLAVQRRTIGQVLRDPLRPRLSRLSLTGGLDARDAEFLGCLTLPRLRHLALDGTRDGVDVPTLFSRTPLTWLKHLERLEVTRTSMGVAALRVLQDRNAPSLRSLNLSDCPVESAESIALMMGRMPPRLERLVLDGSHLGDRGVFPLTAMGSARQLRHLSLRRNQISAQGALNLATSPLLDDLEFLDLRNNPIPPRSARRLRDRFDHADCRVLLDGEGQP